MPASIEEWRAYGFHAFQSLKRGNFLLLGVCAAEYYGRYLAGLVLRQRLYQIEKIVVPSCPVFPCNQRKCNSHRVTAANAALLPDCGTIPHTHRDRREAR